MRKPWRTGTVPRKTRHGQPWPRRSRPRPFSVLRPVRIEAAPSSGGCVSRSVRLGPLPDHEQSIWGPAIRGDHQELVRNGRAGARQLCSTRQAIHGQRGHRDPNCRATLFGSSPLRGRGHRHAAPRRGPIGGPSNKALHQTGRGGVASFLRRRPVVEARPAGERECCADSLARRSD